MLESLGLEIWHVWLLAACVIAVFELLLVGSYYLLALSGGAMVTGLLTAFSDLSESAQWLVFAVATGIAALLMRYLRAPAEKQQADDVSYMIGKQVKVVEMISPRGRVVYKTVTWAAELDKASAESKLEEGVQARITGVHGSTLYVTKLEEVS